LSDLRGVRGLRKFIQFQEIHKENFNAGSKAVEDVTEIARRMGARSWRVVRLTDRDFPLPRIINAVIAAIVWKIQEIALRLAFPREAVLLVQHPLTTGRALMRSKEGLRLVRWLRARKGLKVITLIHDISEIRSGDREVTTDMPDALANVVDYSDAIIVHNARMREWMEQNGYGAKPLIELGAFDYLTDAPFAEGESDCRAITFAGNLRPDKCGFLKRATEISGVDWYLYGPKFDPDAMKGENIHYCGCLKPADLPAHLSKGFGLVWDGDDLDACTGEWGGYLKWNNPHKMSLYLASGLPVVTWSKAAIGEFLKANDAGIVVDSLRELPRTLGEVSAERYAELRQNARKVAERLRRGEFLREALENLRFFDFSICDCI